MCLGAVPCCLCFIARMPSSTLIPFWGFRFPCKPLEAKKGTLFKPRLLGSLDCLWLFQSHFGSTAEPTVAHQFVKYSASEPLGKKP